VLGKFGFFDDVENTLLSGTLTFAPEKRSRRFRRRFRARVISVFSTCPEKPVNAEVTGEAWFFKQPPSPNPTLVASGSSGWRYRETRSEPPTTWKQLNFDDSSPAATEWLRSTLPAGLGHLVSLGHYQWGRQPIAPRRSISARNSTCPTPTQITGLTFRIRRDDAAVVWLNNDSSPTLVSADGTFNPPYSYDATTIATNNVPNST
jgi:hypothetical protein